jgi:hypothetical protein
MRKTAQFPYHPLFVGVFPVVSLIAANIQESLLEDAWRALLASLLVSVTSMALTGTLARDLHKAACLASILLIAFFSYGHVYTALKLTGEFGTQLARHRFLLPMWLLISGLAIWWGTKRVRDFTAASKAFNLTALFLFSIPTIQILSFVSRNLSIGEPATAATFSSITQPNFQSPDIYYIVTDAYARDDVMQEFYDFDNGEFLGQLESLGFYVARCSLSNYPKTRLSLTSSLNLNYLENLGITANDQADEFWRRIRNSVVRKTLEAEGYTIVSFETGFYWTEWPDADFYLSKEDGSPNRVRLNGFESLLLQTTVLRAVEDLQLLPSFQLVNDLGSSPLREHYDVTKFALDNLDELAPLDGPKFVFVHLLIPHGPFVFAEDGGFTEETGDLSEDYIAQVKYLNERLIDSLTTIIQETDRPVAILLQADHSGPGTQLSYDRMKILNAYYMPEARETLYPNISPVNSFRVLFDAYFGSEFGLVPDLSYYSTEEDFFNTTLIDDDRPGCTVN